MMTIPRSFRRSIPGAFVSHRLAVALFITAAFSGCLRIERPYGAPSAAELKKYLESRMRGIRSLRAEAKILDQSQTNQAWGTLRLMIAEHERLRFDIFSPLDTRLSTLVVTDGGFTLRDLRKHQHYHGPASAENLARLVQVRLSPQAVSQILAGGTPLISHDTATVHWDSQAGREVLTLSATNQTQIIRLSGRRGRWRLESSRISNATGVLLLIEASHYRRRNGYYLPSTIYVKQPQRGTALAIKFRRQEVNIALPSAAFNPLPADGLSSEWLGEPR